MPLRLRLLLVGLATLALLLAIPWPSVAPLVGVAFVAALFVRADESPRREMVVALAFASLSLGASAVWAGHGDAPWAAVWAVLAGATGAAASVARRAGVSSSRASTVPVLFGAALLVGLAVSLQALSVLTFDAVLLPREHVAWIGGSVLATVAGVLGVVRLGRTPAALSLASALVAVTAAPLSGRALLHVWAPAVPEDLALSFSASGGLSLRSVLASVDARGTVEGERSFGAKPFLTWSSQVPELGVRRAYLDLVALDLASLPTTDTVARLFGDLVVVREAPVDDGESVSVTVHARGESRWISFRGIEVCERPPDPGTARACAAATRIRAAMDPARWPAEPPEDLVDSFSEIVTRVDLADAECAAPETFDGASCARAAPGEKDSFGPRLLPWRSEEGAVFLVSGLTDDPRVAALSYVHDPSRQFAVRCALRLRGSLAHAWVRQPLGFPSKDEERFAELRDVPVARATGCDVYEVYPVGAPRPDDGPDDETAARPPTVLAPAHAGLVRSSP